MILSWHAPFKLSNASEAISNSNFQKVLLKEMK